jgi:flavin reductase (DIM6/NTAB) family NADH-FMN oxidoreductase RutF
MPADPTNGTSSAGVVALAELASDYAPLVGGDSARRALRRIAAGVTVLTINDGGVRHGTTVSAIMPISRDPLVLGACLRTSSSFTAMARRQKLFSVNVLGAGQAHLADRFANACRPAGEAQFGGLSWNTDQYTDAPLIAGCLAYLACQATTWLRIGDHDLIVAEVLAGAPADGAPLLTFAGRLDRKAAARRPHSDPTPIPQRSEER